MTSVNNQRVSVDLTFKDKFDIIALLNVFQLPFN